MTFRNSLRTLLAASVFASWAAALPMVTNAQGYPSKQLRIVVAFPAGGPIDIVARMMTAKLGEAMGQSVIVENKPGASGSIGTAAFIKSPADGYTISMFGMPALIAPIVYRNNLYDSRKDFSCVSTVYDVPYVLVVNPKALAGVDNLQQLMVVAKTQDLSYATPGTGSIAHLSMEQLKDLGGFKMQHISYKGSAPAMNDLLGGQLPVMYADLIAALPHIQSGRLKAIALGSADAKVFLPAIKSFAEQGFTGFRSSSWSGVIVPNGTPSDVVARLDKELKSILADKDTRERMEKIGALAAYQPSEQMKSRLVDEYTRWYKVATDKNITAQ